MTFRISSLHFLEDWLWRKGKRRLDEVTVQDLRAAQAHFGPTQSQVSDAIATVTPYLVDRGLIVESRPGPVSHLEQELIDWVAYLREIRGLSESTIRHYRYVIGELLRFLDFGHRPSAIRALSIQEVEAFVRAAAKRNTRHSLQQVIGALRLFLRRAHSQGILSKPLHEQIDTPRIYQLERLPRALPWEQVSALLRSIDRSRADGIRDFTMLYLAARLGLRSKELVNLRLDGIDWRGRTLQVAQTKTKHSLLLPLADETGDILCHYLRTARPHCDYRELFLRLNAPIRPMVPTSVNAILANRIRRSGLVLPHVSSHCLRHSLSVHLLRQGASIKDIGDTLGHHSIRATSVYLRLAIDDLRKIGLPVPRTGLAAPLAAPGWQDKIHGVRLSPPPLGHSQFRSAFALSFQEYLANRRALGRGYEHEERILLRWDDFVHQHYRGVRVISAPMFARWAEGPIGQSPTTRRYNMRALRNFLLFHRRSDPSTYVPDLAFFPKAVPYRAPRLLTEPEVARLLATAKTLPGSSHNPMRGPTVHLALVLLFCCGLRRGELLRLRLADFDADEQLLRINETKFHKSRLVPLPISVTRELDHYLARRRRRGLPMAAETRLICCSADRPVPNDGYKRNGLTWNWQHLCVSAGVLDGRGRPPRLHDLRHSMAVCALHRCYATGEDPQSKLQHLATYLGHATAVSTHHYLHLTADLREAASRRFHDRCAANLFKKGGES
jgi:site-specific recombinase XerD